MFVYLLIMICRLNKRPPNISYKRKDKGGINLTCAVRSLIPLSSSLSLSLSLPSSGSSVKLGSRRCTKYPIRISDTQCRYYTSMWCNRWWSHWYSWRKQVLSVESNILLYYNYNTLYYNYNTMYYNYLGYISLVFIYWTKLTKYQLR